MKNIFAYYFSLFVPLFLLLNFWKNLDPTLALILLVAYVFIYRTWIDGSRLYQKGLIAKEDIWKVSFNGSRINYFKALYLEK